MSAGRDLEPSDILAAMKIPHDAVEALIRETLELFIMPRFDRLLPGEISEKQANDFVTIADTEAEQHMTPRLTALLPGSHVLGEEAASRNPDLLRLLESDDLLWLVDPIDGTRSFMAAQSGFAVIIALVRAGEILGGWIHQPIGERWVHVERGAGVTTSAATMTPRAGMSGFFLGRAPDGARSRDSAAAANIDARLHPGSGAIAFIDLAMDDVDLAYFARGWPWDHAAGALIAHEKGGVANFLVDAARYTPRRWNQPLLVARDQGSWDLTRDALITRR